MKVQGEQELESLEGHNNAPAICGYLYTLAHTETNHGYETNLT